MFRRRDYMKICMLIDVWRPIWGGGQTHVWELSKELIKNYSCEIDIFTRALVDKDGKVFNKTESYFNKKLTIYRLSPASDFFNISIRFYWLIAVVIKVLSVYPNKKYNLLHAHAFSAGIPGKILSFILKIPLVFTVHGSHNLDLNNKNIVYFIENFLLTKIPYSQEITVSSKFLKYKNVNKNVKVIPNGVNILDFNNSKSPTLKTNGKRFFKLLWVGRFDKFKGLEILTHAFYLALLNKSQMVLTLVGDGPTKSNIRHLVSWLGIRLSVKFIKKQQFKKLRSYYNQTDIFVLPSLAEGQSISLLEALAAEKPAVATNVGENYRSVINGYNGYLIKPNDVNELCTAIQQANMNSNLTAWGKRSQKIVEIDNSWKAVSSKTYKTYEKLIL